MFKRNQTTGAPLFPYESERDATEAWKISKEVVYFSDKARSFLALHFGVMYNTEMYRRFQFLGLAEALESYHASCRERPISRKWDDQIKVIQRLYPQILRGCINKIKECYKPDFRARVTEVYESTQK
jgi:hypothetical protein